MKLISGAGSLFECRGDYYIVPVFEGEGEGQFKRAVYGALGQRFASLFSKKELAAGYLKKTFISVDAQKALKKVLFIGLGKRKKLDTEKTRQAAGFCVKELRSLGVLSAASFLWDKDEAKKRAQIEGFFLGAYRYANDAKAPKSLVSMEIAGLDGKLGREMNTLLSNVFSTRDMMNAPANIVTPSYIEKKAREAALGRKNLSVRAFGLNEARKMGMGAFCAVAQGSSEPARFIIMEYRGAAKSRKPLVFIGKGITFDSGGISLKPQSSALSKIEDMRYDMSGAAVVLHLLKTLSELKLPVNAVGLLPCTENLPDGGAYKPGDVLKTMSGKTVEVISTDAEGRLVLADAMTYALKKYRPEAMLDIATLTGGCVIALGHYATGLMGNDEKLKSQLRKAGDETGERVWELPLFEEYLEQIKTKFADIKNTGGGDAASITAGLFLREFAGSSPWAHLDIAGTAYGVKNKHYIPDGTAATGLRLLYAFIKNNIKEEVKK